MSSPAADRALIPLLRKQHGAFSRKQALAAGWSDRTLMAAQRSGRVLRLAPGVYADASHPATWQRQLMAAVLVHDGRAAVTGKAAAALWGFEGFHPVRPQLLVPHTTRTANDLASVSRTRHFEKSDLARVTGVPVVRPARLAVELASSLNPAELGRLVDDAVLRRKLDLDDLLGRSAALLRGRHGGRDTMRAVLEDRLGGYVPAQSELEAVLFETLDGAGYREHLRQFHIPMDAGPSPVGVVDALIPPRVIVEADGRKWHARFDAWERDRRRDLDFLGSGFIPIRVTWRALTTQPRTFLRALARWVDPTGPTEATAPNHWVQK